MNINRRLVNLESQIDRLTGSDNGKDFKMKTFLDEVSKELENVMNDLLVGGDNVDQNRVDHLLMQIRKVTHLSK